MHKEELAAFEARVQDRLAAYQKTARSSKYSGDLWFGELELLSLKVDETAAEFRFRSAEGFIVGYRWPLYWEKQSAIRGHGVDGAATLCAMNLEEAALTSGLSEPDENGVRWLEE